MRPLVLLSFMKMGTPCEKCTSYPRFSKRFRGCGKPRSLSHAGMSGQLEAVIQRTRLFILPNPSILLLCIFYVSFSPNEALVIQNQTLPPYLLSLTTKMSLKNGKSPEWGYWNKCLFCRCIPLLGGFRCHQWCPYFLRCWAQGCGQEGTSSLCFHIEEQGRRDRKLAHWS